MSAPNKLPTVDAAITFPLAFVRFWRGTTEAKRWASSPFPNTNTT